MTIKQHVPSAVRFDISTEHKARRSFEAHTRLPPHARFVPVTVVRSHVHATAVTVADAGHDFLRRAAITPTILVLITLESESQSDALSCKGSRPIRAGAASQTTHAIGHFGRCQRTLAFITLSTRYICHPAAMDFFTGDSADPALDWNAAHIHEPHSRRQNTGSAVASIATLTATGDAGSSVLFPTSTASASVAASQTATSTASSTGIPTIPESAPILPTPFPQPFDTAMASSTNMSSSCSAFMTNMTGTLPFRQCRAFSFLSQVSSEFLQAQTNVSQLNVDVWGTCNTALSEDQCSSNMAWFADQLKTDCADDLKSQNAEVVQSLASLQTYGLLRQAGCLADSTTGSYCYVEAAASTNPSDLYLYSLPFGLGLPTSATPSCSTCSKSIMALYMSEAPSVDGLKQTYNDAAEQQNSRCGSTFAVVASSLPDSSNASGADKLHIIPKVFVTTALFLTTAVYWL
ncbi:unnamed protein product [Peniophora sp. CBMAI 1063]|nr:unnamed protein product [Peniophora sp. CBMAI 1063]